MSSADSTRLKPKQLKALYALAAGATVASAAAVAKASEQTVYTWRKQSAFAAELERVQGYQRDRMLGMLGAIDQKVKTALEDGLTATDSEKKPLHPVRIRAALGVVNAVEAFTRRTAEAQPLLDRGPLIVLPAGTERMAVALQGRPSKPTPETPAAEPIEITAVVVPEPPELLEPPPKGLPVWWKGPNSR